MGLLQSKKWGYIVPKIKNLQKEIVMKKVIFWVLLTAIGLTQAMASGPDSKKLYVDWPQQKQPGVELYVYVEHAYEKKGLIPPNAQTKTTKFYLGESGRATVSESFEKGYLHRIRPGEGYIRSLKIVVESKARGVAPVYLIVSSKKLKEINKLMEQHEVSKLRITVKPEVSEKKVLKPNIFVWLEGKDEQKADFSNTGVETNDTQIIDAENGLPKTSGFETIWDPAINFYESN